LPNYVLPIYPALALLTGRFLIRWQAGAIQPWRSMIGLSLGCVGLVGVAVGGGLLVASGIINEEILRGRAIPELAPWAFAGLIPLAGALFAARFYYQQRRRAALVSVIAAGVLVVATLSAFAPLAVDPHKVNKPFAVAIREHSVERDIQVVCYHYYQPGVVFYTQRKVRSVGKEQDAIDMLHSPLQTFMLVPETVWTQMASKVDGPACVVARQHDYQQGREIVLVTNRDPGAVRPQTAMHREWKATDTAGTR
jgi:hypothetical protein